MDIVHSHFYSKLTLLSLITKLKSCDVSTSLRFNFPGFHSPRVLKTPSICLSSSGLHLVVHLALHNIFLTVDHHSDHSLIIIFRIIDEKFDLAVKALKDHIFGYRAGSFLLTETLSPIPLSLIPLYPYPHHNSSLTMRSRSSISPWPGTIVSPFCRISLAL